MRVCVLAEPVLLAFRSFHKESLQIRITLLVGIEENGSPNFSRLVFLHNQDVLLVVVVRIEVRYIEFAVVENDQNQVFVVEFAEESSVLIVVQTVDIGVKPHFTAAERTVSVAL